MDRLREKPVILDCTIRDGSYAIDFKFTQSDTGLLTKELANLGFEWIEIGHGLGLGAMEAGKGDMPASDIEMIRTAKAACGNSKIGMFFIPGIGRFEQLSAAREAGLDFIRIGTNATEIGESYSYLAESRKLGFTPCLNVMKTYAITPKEFAEKSKEAIDAGAEIIYCVDSSGSMLPEDVARYFDATKQIINCKLGFHGHNNLMLAIANSISAYEHGATYLDTSLCGLGRSAGNAPAEILIAILKRLGVPLNIDLFKVMDVIELYLWPLVCRTRPHDTMAIVSGYSQFHSSFTPKVAAAAKKYNSELRRLIAKVALHDPVNIDDSFLDASAQELSGSGNFQTSSALLSFYSPEISHKRISNSMEAVKSLINGLSTASVKSAGTRTVLHLVPSEKSLDGVLLPEFVLSDSQMVMGRITFGSLEILKDILNIARSNISLFLINQGRGLASEAAKLITEQVGKERTLLICAEKIQTDFLIQMVNTFAQRLGTQNLLIYGSSPLMLAALEKRLGFDAIYLFGSKSTTYSAENNLVLLNQWEDWSNLKIKFDAILCCAGPTEVDLNLMLSSLTNNGRIISVLPHANILLQETAKERLSHLNLNLAYSGIIARHLAVESIFSPINDIII